MWSLLSLDSSSLREPRNLRDIFVRCVPFLIVLSFGFALVIHCQGPGFSSTDAGLSVWPKWSNHYRYYIHLPFPKPLYLNLKVLVFGQILSLLWHNAGVSRYCHINQPDVFLFNYGDIWYIVSKVFVCLELEVPQNLNIICFKDFLHLVFPPIVGCWYAVLLTQIPVQHCDNLVMPLFVVCLGNFATGTH